MKKTIIIVALVVIAFGALVWWAKSQQQTQTTNVGGSGALVASEKVYNFGTISMKNGDVSKKFIVTNQGNQSIFISSIVTSCMCTTAFIDQANGKAKGPFGMRGMGYVPPANETISPGQSRTIRVVFDPNAHGPAGVGRIIRFITLTEASGKQLRLEIKALVTP